MLTKRAAQHVGRFTSSRSSTIAVPSLRCCSVLPTWRPRDVRMAATTSQDDFDAILNKVAEKWEKADNKPAVGGYLAAAVAAVFFVEWFIHLPALDILVGWPIQLLGIFTLPVLAARYYLEKNDLGEDLESVVGTITKELPGFNKD